VIITRVAARAARRNTVEETSMFHRSRTSAASLTAFVVAIASSIPVTVLGGASLTPAGAQTPTELVALFVWGLEESPTSKRTGKDKWVVTGPNSAISRFAIRRITECRYGAHLQQIASNGELVRLDYLLDFSAVTEYDTWMANGTGSSIIIKIEGIRWYSKRLHLKNGDTREIGGGSVETNIIGQGTVARLRGAYALFRTKYCEAAP
jgi:hypothetical protein